MKKCLILIGVAMAAKKIPHFEKNMCSTAGANLPSGPIVPFQKRVNAVSHAPARQIGAGSGAWVMSLLPGFNCLISDYEY